MLRILFLVSLVCACSHFGRHIMFIVLLYVLLFEALEIIKIYCITKRLQVAKLFLYFIDAKRNSLFLRAFKL